MKLYATITSERATKGQGGEWLVIDVMGKNKNLLWRIMIDNETDIVILEPKGDKMKDVAKIVKGKQQKGEKREKGWQAYQKICSHKWHKPFINEEKEICSICGVEKGKKQKGEKCYHESVRFAINAA